MKIVTLIGSTDARFRERTCELIHAETVRGHVVLTHWISREIGGQELAVLKRVHQWKIAVADEVLVCNFDGYIGAGARDEIAYATALNKPIRFVVAP